MATTYGTSAPTIVPDTRWRTRDIIIAAVIGVAFGVVFWVWNLAWAGPLDIIFSFAPPNGYSYADIPSFARAWKTNARCHGPSGNGRLKANRDDRNTRGGRACHGHGALDGDVWR